MSTSRLYIGIDCGVETGYAVWDTETRRLLDVRTLRLHQALTFVLNIYEQRIPLTVVFEDARQRRWIPREGSLAQWKGRAMGAGSVKRDAVIWEDFCKDLGIPYLAEPPKKGLTKWNAETFKKVTGWKGRTSNHARDAALLVFGR